MKNNYNFLVIVVLFSIFVIGDTNCYADNNISAVSVSFLIFNPKTNKFDIKVNKDGYEIFLKLQKEVRIKPVAIFRNASQNEIGFRVACNIINLGRDTYVYSDTAAITGINLKDSLASGIYYVDINGNSIPYPTSKYNSGLPPGGFVKIIFNENDLEDSDSLDIGTLIFKAFSDNFLYPSGKFFPNEDFSDDTLKIKLNSLNILSSFSRKKEFSKIDSTHFILNPDFWLNTGAEVVDGNQFCYNPHHSISYSMDSNTHSYYNVRKKYTPILRMNRVDLKGNEYNPGKRGGDNIISQVIDIRNCFNSNISLSYQRTGRMLPNTDCGWSDSIIYGPEHRVILNSDSSNEYRKPDELIVEIIGASSDSLLKLTNISDKAWINYPRRGSAPPETENPALTIFGGGGYRTAFLETDKDSILNYQQGLRCDLYDDGKDTYFKKAYFVIPDTFVKMGFIRLRVRVNANNDSIANFAKDDYDDFFFESLDVFKPADTVDLSIDNIHVTIPYTITTLRQSIRIPVKLRFSNNTNINAAPFRIKLQIKYEKDSVFDFNKMNFPYNYSEPIPFMSQLISVDYPWHNLDFVYFNNQSKNKLNNGRNKIQMLAAFPDSSFGPFEEEAAMDENSFVYSEFDVYFDSVLAYDNPEIVRNNLPEFTGIPGRGLNLYGFCYSGDGGDYGNDGLYASGSGQIAIKFTLFQPDTIFGIQAFFGSHNPGTDDICLAIYSDSSYKTYYGSYSGPYSMIKGSIIYKKRGCDDIRNKTFFDEYVTYKYDNPIILTAGSYWASVSQLGAGGFELGASKYRTGMLSMNLDSVHGNQNYFGGNSMFLLINDNLKKSNSDGTLSNNNFFYYENTRGSGQWEQFTPDMFNPAYAHLNAAGAYNEDRWGTFSRGTFAPMLRVILSNPEKYNGTMEKPVTTNILKINNVYPNPVNNKSVIDYSLPHSGNVDLSLFDIIGRKIISLIDTYQDGGTQSLIFNTGNVPNGIYLMKLTCDSEIDTKTIIINK